MPELQPTTLPLLEMFWRLLAAMIFGGLVGWEREAKHRSAGLRTHILVSIGSAGVTIAALEMLRIINHLDSGNAGADPFKVLAGIIGGIGFLGAGAIMQTHDRVRGLTTAAGIWTVAAVGIAAGMGSYALAAMLTGFTLLTLLALRFLEPRKSARADDDAEEPVRSNGGRPAQSFSRHSSHGDQP